MGGVVPLDRARDYECFFLAREGNFLACYQWFGYLSAQNTLSVLFPIQITFCRTPGN
ncbi:hypothetical protein IAD21_00270 [Abditibacteriota bacterium]|nr:hypothetical protein IAD21_00270 [Abditibacteriota bacterium]